MEVAAGVGHEASRHEGAADEGRAAAAPLQQADGDAIGKATAGNEDAQANQVGLQLVLLGYLDEVVARLVQVGVAHGKRRLEAEKLVGQLDHRARHSPGLGRDADGIAAGASIREGAADAHDGRQLGVGAQGAATLYA